MKKVLLPFLLLFIATPVFAGLTCSQVTCDEARNYPQMDRDNDGYYCEAQCGHYVPAKKAVMKTTKAATVKAALVKKAAIKTTVKSKYILGPK